MPEDQHDNQVNNFVFVSFWRGADQCCDFYTNRPSLQKLDDDVEYVRNAVFIWQAHF